MTGTQSLFVIRASHLPPRSTIVPKWIERSQGILDGIQRHRMTAIVRFGMGDRRIDEPSPPSYPGRRRRFRFRHASISLPGIIHDPAGQGDQHARDYHPHLASRRSIDRHHSMPMRQLNVVPIANDAVAQRDPSRPPADAYAPFPPLSKSIERRGGGR